mmetsp:Transcript_21350/g.40183  ORF Transcript_21350/g.40183 Transcript_21350/m.40183 type:complete len:153 (-) Transcript_21350:108-566(-)
MPPSGRAHVPASRGGIWNATAAARRAAKAVGASPRALGAALKAAKAAWKQAEAQRRARPRKRAPKPKVTRTAPGLHKDEAERLASAAAACKEAWDAREAVRLLRRAALLMESAQTVRKWLRQAANDVLQVLDVEDPKTRELVGDALRVFGVK